MSIASFFNSPRPNYEISNLSAVAPEAPIDATAAHKITSIVRQTDGTVRTISVPAGIYNLNMFCQIDTGNTGVFEQIGSYSLRLVDLSDPANNPTVTTAIATTTAYSIGCIPDGSAWFVNDTQRIELPQKADGSDYLFSMYMITVWNTQNIAASNGAAAASSMGITGHPKFSLRPTF